MDISYFEFPSLNLDNVQSPNENGLQQVDLDEDYLGININSTPYELFQLHKIIESIGMPYQQ